MRLEKLRLRDYGDSALNNQPLQGACDRPLVRRRSSLPAQDAFALARSRASRRRSRRSRLGLARSAWLRQRGKRGNLQDRLRRLIDQRCQARLAWCRADFHELKYVLPLGRRSPASALNCRSLLTLARLKCTFTESCGLSSTGSSWVSTPPNCFQDQRNDLPMR